MKTKLVLLAAAFVLNHSALAQTSTETVTTSPASAEAANPGTSANTSVATDNTAAAATGVTLGIKYVGVLHGPGLEFSGAHTAANQGSGVASKDDYGDLFVDNRPKFIAKFNPKTEAGLEPRFNTFFGNGNKMHASAGAWRLFANFKHVYKDDVFDLTLTPRAVLPMKTAFRNQKGTVSPDMIADLSISPKNSRFSLDTGMEYIQYFHTAGATGNDYSKAITAIVAPWLEVDYQLTAKSQLMVSYWPELVAQARLNSPLHSDGNEIDLGGYYEFAKGWQLNPYVATEMFGIDTSNPQRNMQVNLIVVGTIL